jgi:hypothetical protein
MNVSFDFLRENLKPLLKFSFYLILPLCLVQSFFMSSFMRIYFGIVGSGPGGDAVTGALSATINYGLLMACIMLGNILLSALVYGLIQTYESRENRLSGLVLADIRELLVKNGIKVTRVILLTFGAVFLSVAAILLPALVSPWTLMLTVPLFLFGLFAAAVPFTLLTPLYLFEDLSFTAALRKAMKYGFFAWGETFLVILVFGLLAGMISGVSAMPWYLVTVIGYFFSLADPETAINSSAGYRFLTYLLGIIQIYGAYVSNILSLTGLAFHYFHLREKNEGIAMKADIVNFDRL